MKKSLSFISLFAMILLTTNCNKSDDTVIINSIEYQITELTNSNITGTATFTKDSDGATHVLINLNGSTTSEHPAYIRYNTATAGGPVAITLSVCECSVSSTIVTQLDDGTPISYESLIKLNGHISIHESSNNLENIVAVANIGSNAN